MVEWLKLTTNIRRFNEDKTLTEHFQFRRKTVAGESRLYLSRFENKFVPESQVGRTVTAPSEHDTTVTYKWEYHEPVSKNLSLDPE